VIAATKAGRLAALFEHNLGRAMTANIPKSPKDAGFIPHEDDWRPCDVGGQELSGLGRLFRSPDELPTVAEYCVLLCLGDFRVGVPRRRNRVSAFERNTWVKAGQKRAKSIGH
jgi:hypothetical protein